MRIYGIYWTRDGIEPGQYVNVEDVDWRLDDDLAGVRREFTARDDKYWPSVIFAAELTNLTLVDSGESPFDEPPAPDRTRGEETT